ncbi:MAG: ATP-binding cassette domain-containing protein, partial [Rhodospirillales bacterium]|nr:ATP-binding cassette domain-containing protein [Rhodospirillales bacterium]
MEATNTKIEIRGLWKIFGPRSDAACLRAKAGASKQELLEASGHVLALKNIDLNIAAGGIHVIMGLSGSGKSTLVRHINRLVEPTEGQIYIDGEDVLGLDTSALTQLRRHRVSMVFQSFALLPHRNVTENIAYGLAQQGMAKPERETIAAHWTERVGLQGFEASYPRQLSGG